MNANELRRLNLVNYQGVVKIVNSISLSMVGLSYRINIDEFEYANIPIKNIKPIPLTEEILLKCGAKCLGFADEFNEIKQYDLGYGVIIDFYVKINEFDVYYCNNIIECYDDREIKLHELQNLYLGLTRKELEINL